MREERTQSIVGDHADHHRDRASGEQKGPSESEPS
jgi:hypothetical protein